MNGVQIKQLAIHTQQEPLQAQLGVERLLRTMHLQPRGMQEGEFLFIRHLRIDVPLDTRRVLDGQWESLVQDKLTQYAQQAYRPDKREHVIPAHYDSICFPDAVHVLVCLTNALLYQHDILYSWLLQNALPQQVFSVPSALALLWVTHVRALPAMTRYLPPNTLLNALQQLDDKALRGILKKLHRAYGLPKVHLQSTENIVYLLESSAELTLLQNVDVYPSNTMMQRYFVGLCSILHQRPTFAHSPNFQPIMQTWLRQSADPTNRSSDFDEHRTQFPAPIISNNATSIHIHQPREESPTAETSPFDGHPYVTQLGGVFYLIHCLSWLGLPTVAQRSFIGGWGMLEGVARTLLGDDIERFADDAIWQILRQLDHRADDISIGEAWQPSDDLHVPEQWLPYLDQTEFDINQRTQAHNHPRNFEDWLHLNQQILLTLIARRLNLRIDEFDPVALLQKPATIYLSNTHIDVVQHINMIDMRVRRSGWDIDPGWRPDLGYIIYFHFIEG